MNVSTAPIVLFTFIFVCLKYFSQLRISPTVKYRAVICLLGAEVVEAVKIQSQIFEVYRQNTMSDRMVHK